MLNNVFNMATGDGSVSRMHYSQLFLTSFSLLIACKLVFPPPNPNFFYLPVFIFFIRIP